MIDLQREHVGFVYEARGIAHVGLPSSLSPTDRPLTVWVGHAFRMLAPTVLTAGCARNHRAGELAASRDRPGAGGRAAGDATSTPGLNRRTAAPPTSGPRKVAAALASGGPDTAVRALSTIDTLR